MAVVPGAQELMLDIRQSEIMEVGAPPKRSMNRSLTLGGPAVRTQCSTTTHDHFADYNQEKKEAACSQTMIRKRLTP